MKPLTEFILACLLIFVAGCSAVAEIFNASIWTSVFIAGSAIGLIILFTTKARDKQ